MQKSKNNLIKIKSLEIIGLFDLEDIVIPFNEETKILIGENGLGKTQILNILYYTLKGNYFKLNEYNFKKIKLTFENNESIYIDKNIVEKKINEVFKHPYLKDIIDDIGLDQFNLLFNKFNNDKKFFINNEENFYRFNKLERRLPLHRLKRVFEEIFSNPKEIEFFNAKNPHIYAELNKFEILYFPTYRRVEEDLYKLGIEEDEFNLNEENSIIQFGMDDVKKRFKKIQNKIINLSKDGFTEFTKDILNIVIEPENKKKIKFDKVSINDIDLILSRVGNLMPEQQKATIKKNIENQNLENPLTEYLLFKLIEIYEKQKEFDKAIQNFRDVCNKYLINKAVIYDEKEIKIFIQSNNGNSNQEIDLKNLSSGEKQIISIFSKLYLTNDLNKKFIILFDEPELSLSMNWQKNLLPDIVNSNKCNFLFAVTHSPFIFENNLDNYAVGINEYIKPLKNRVLHGSTRIKK